MKYLILYTFDGRGRCVIEANSEEEAEELFYEGGNTIDDIDESQNYEIEKVIIEK